MVPQTKDSDLEGKYLYLLLCSGSRDPLRIVGVEHQTTICALNSEKFLATPSRT